MQERLRLAEEPQLPPEEQGVAWFDAGVLEGGGEGGPAPSGEIPGSYAVPAPEAADTAAAHTGTGELQTEAAGTETGSSVVIRRTGGWALRTVAPETSSAFDDPDIYKKRGGGGWLIREYMKKQQAKAEHEQGCDCQYCRF